VSPADYGAQKPNAVAWRPYHYSTAIFSDDGDRVWRTSNPFSVLGTGEGAIAEPSDGTLLDSSRAHMSRGSRFFARSEDGGDLWIGAFRSAELPAGARGTAYGLRGGHDPAARCGSRHPAGEQHRHRCRHDARGRGGGRSPPAGKSSRCGRALTAVARGPPARRARSRYSILSGCLTAVIRGRCGRRKAAEADGPLPRRLTGSRPCRDRP